MFPSCAAIAAYGGIALHDTRGDFSVAIPGGILHHHPAVRPRLRAGETHGIVVVHIGNAGVCTEPANVLQPLEGAALGQIDHAAAAESVGRPGYAAAVIAVRGRYEGDFANGGAQFGLRQGSKINRRQPETLGQYAGNAVAAAQYLEGVQIEAAAFILDVNGRHAERPCKGAERDQRRFAVVGQAAVKGQRSPGGFQTEGVCGMGLPRRFPVNHLDAVHVRLPPQALEF